MRNKLLSGGLVPLALFISGLFIMANPPTKPPEQKPQPGTKPPAEAKKPDDPKEVEAKAKKAFADSFDKRNKTKGYHFSGKRETQYVEMGMTIPASFDGVKNNGENLMYMVYQTQVMGGAKKYELYQKGDRKFARDIASEERVEGKTHSPIMQGDRLKDALKDYKLGKDEKLNERDHSVLEASIKEEGAAKLLADLPMPLPAEAKLTCDKSGFKIWVDKKTALISKMYFFVEVTAAMAGEEAPEEGAEAPPKSGRKIYVEIDISDYDKEIEITVPEEINEILNEKDE